MAADNWWLILPLLHLLHTGNIIRNHGSVSRCYWDIETTQAPGRRIPSLPLHLENNKAQSLFWLHQSRSWWRAFPVLPRYCNHVHNKYSMSPWCVYHQPGPVNRASVGPSAFFWCHLLVVLWAWWQVNDCNHHGSFISSFRVIFLWCLSSNIIVCCCWLGPWAMWRWAALLSQQSLWLDLADLGQEIW